MLANFCQVIFFSFFGVDGIEQVQGSFISTLSLSLFTMKIGSKNRLHTYS